MPKVQPLSRTLKQQWDGFEKKFYSTRKKASVKNVHALRVATRRLEAILLLVNSLKPTRKSQKILSVLKKVRKSLGPLRDIQVEEVALQELRFKEVKPKKGRTFQSYLSRKKSDAKKKTYRSLRNISLKQKRKSLYQIEKKLQAFESKKERAQIETRLNEKIKSGVLMLNSAIPSQGPVPIERIHRCRILAKQCRYQSECMKSLTGRSLVDLQKLRRLHYVAGKVQNEKVLIETLDRFLQKKENRDNLQALALRQKVREIQTRLMKTKRAH